MSQSVKIIVSLVVAAVASSVTTILQDRPLPDLPLIVAFFIATVVTALLVSLPAFSGPHRKVTSSGSVGGDSSERDFGKVKWFNVSKGFGFITMDDGEEIFVHFRSIRGEGRRGLRDGQRVSFVIANSEKGPQAEDVTAED